MCGCCGIITDTMKGAVELQTWSWPGKCSKLIIHHQKAWKPFTVVALSSQFSFFEDINLNMYGLTFQQQRPEFILSEENTNTQKISINSQCLLVECFLYFCSILSKLLHYCLSGIFILQSSFSKPLRKCLADDHLATIT